MVCLIVLFAKLRLTRVIAPSEAFRGNKFDPSNRASAILQLSEPNPENPAFLMNAPIKLPSNCQLIVPDILHADHRPQNTDLSPSCNLTPRFVVVHPHIDQIRDSLITVLGKSRKFVLMWPLSRPNRELLVQYALAHERETFVPLCGQLEAPVLDLMDSKTALFMQAGVIHATLTLEGGMLIGINTFSAGSALASLQCFVFELEAEVERDYGAIFNLFALQLKAIVGDLDISRQFLRGWVSLSSKITATIVRRDGRKKLTKTEKTKLNNMMWTLLAVAQQEGVLPDHCCGSTGELTHFRDVHLVPTSFSKRKKMIARNTILQRQSWDGGHFAD